MTTFTKVSSSPVTLTYWDQIGNGYTILGGSVIVNYGSTSSLGSTVTYTVGSNNNIVSLDKISGSISIPIKPGTYVAAQYRNSKGTNASEGAIGWYLPNNNISSMWQFVVVHAKPDSDIHFMTVSSDIVMTYNGMESSYVTFSVPPPSGPWDKNKYFGNNSYFGGGTVTAPFTVTTDTYIKSGSSFDYYSYGPNVSTPTLFSYTFVVDTKLTKENITKLVTPYYPGIYMRYMGKYLLNYDVGPSVWATSGATTIGYFYEKDYNKTSNHYMGDIGPFSYKVGTGIFKSLIVGGAASEYIDFVTYYVNSNTFGVHCYCTHEVSFFSRYYDIYLTTSIGKYWLNGNSVSYYIVFSDYLGSK